MGGQPRYSAIWCYRGGEFLYRLSTNKRTRLCRQQCDSRVHDTNEESGAWKLARPDLWRGKRGDPSTYSTQFQRPPRAEPVAA
jgi:hypothetical protein